VLGRPGVHQTMHHKNALVASLNYLFKHIKCAGPDLVASIWFHEECSSVHVPNYQRFPFIIEHPFSRNLDKGFHLTKK
jgi:hypothetical protein